MQVISRAAVVFAFGLALTIGASGCDNTDTSCEAVLEKVKAIDDEMGDDEDEHFVSACEEYLTENQRECIIKIDDDAEVDALARCGMAVADD